MKRTMLNTILCGCIVGFVSAQESTERPHDAVFLELSGQRTFASLSYDRALTDEITLRGGFGILPNLTHAKRVAFSFPFTANYLHGKVHRLELSFGFSWDAVYAGPLPMMMLGYRYDPADGGIVFRLAVNPLFSLRQTYNVTHGDAYRDVQFAFGYSF